MTFLSSASQRTQLFKKTLLALAVCGLAFPSASTAQVSPEVSNGNGATAAHRQSPQTESQTILEDGTYLFGQSSTPDQMGAAYAIFSVQNNRTVGAFYHPHSSFDCFSGEITPNQLAVNVVDSYEQTVRPYSVALTVEDALVAGEGAGAYTLEGFYRIADISANDYDMLAVCQADFAQ